MTDEARLADDGCTNEPTDCCRECGQVFPSDQLELYYVQREDGDYPNTLLCEECTHEYDADDDVRYIFNEDDVLYLMRQFSVVETVGNGDGTFTHSWTTRGKPSAD